MLNNVVTHSLGLVHGHHVPSTVDLHKRHPSTCLDQSGIHAAHCPLLQRSLVKCSLGREEGRRGIVDGTERGGKSGREKEEEGE